MIIIFSFVILSITYKKGGTMGTDNLVFLEVVECSDGTEKELVHSIPAKGSGMIKSRVQSRVPDSQAAFFSAGAEAKVPLARAGVLL